MKSLFIFILISITFYNTSAQVKAFSPLSCFTWGPDQFLDFETVQGLVVAEPPGPYSRPPESYKATSYQSFGKDRGVYSWFPDDVDIRQYINNVQVLRWNIVKEKAPYIITVTDMYDDKLYSVSTENSCGIIMFPDSIENPNGFISVSIKNSDQEDITSQLLVINFARINLVPANKEKRLSILNKLKNCTSLECKIEILKAQKLRLDMLSLLELEKMKDPTNKAIDKLYWEIVSEIRYDFSNRAWER